MTQIFNELEAVLGKGRVDVNKNLFPYLTLRTQTKAEYFFEAKSRTDLQKARLAANKLGLKFYILGGGSNLAVIKEKINGLTVKNSYLKKEILSEDGSCVEVLVSSGYPVSRLVTETVEAGMSGFEYHKGLPGTVGGAVYMNAKWTQAKKTIYFSDNLIYAYLLSTDGKVRKENHDYFQFAYDYSVLQKTKEILLEAVFRLTKMDKRLLRQRSDAALKYRKQTQPYGIASSGCFFRNIPEETKIKKGLPTTSAGYLIDKAGLKGYAVGNFYVSDKHANFILNKGGGKPEDLIKLLHIIKTRVKEKFGIELEEEVIIV